MSLPKGRIVRRAALRHAEPVTLAGATIDARGRILQRAIADAAVEARERVIRAEQAARAVVEDAERAAAAIREKACSEGRAEGSAELLAAWIKLRAEEASRDEKDLDRLVQLARVLAERLLGEALAIDPAKIVAMARQTLAAASQARRIVLSAHPEDAAALRKDAAVLGLEEAAIEIHADGARTRGSLLLETDLGILDADLTIQLDRLARSLRDGLRP